MVAIEPVFTKFTLIQQSTVKTLHKEFLDNTMQDSVADTALHAHEKTDGPRWSPR